MTVQEVIEKLNLKAVGGRTRLAEEVTGAYCSDLLSDVMAHARQGNLWLTIQTHTNVVAVASLLNLAAVVITGGGAPDPEVIARAEKEGIPLLLTQLHTFEAAGELHRLL